MFESILEFVTLESNMKYVAELYREATKKNVNKWGTSKDMNILFITGISGSGKSTLARGLSDDNTEVIHLDIYFGNHPESKNENSSWNNKSFKGFMKSKGFDYFKVSDKELFKTNRDKYFSYVDKFANLIIQYGKALYDEHKKLIVEGIQISNGTLFENTNFLNSKPYIKLNTDEELAKTRAVNRDKDF